MTISHLLCSCLCLVFSSLLVCALSLVFKLVWISVWLCLRWVNERASERNTRNDIYLSLSCCLGLVSSRLVQRYEQVSPYWTARLFCHQERLQFLWPNCPETRLLWIRLWWVLSWWTIINCIAQIKHVRTYKNLTFVCLCAWWCVYAFSFSTRIAEPGSIWLDTYYQWIGDSSQCCGINPNNRSEFCDNPQNSEWKTPIALTHWPIFLFFHFS